MDTNSGCEAGTDSGTGHMYDGEDHLIQTASSTTSFPLSTTGNCKPSTTSGQTMAYAWGPTGHPNIATVHFSGPNVVNPSNSLSESMHWDGGELLYTSNATSGLDTIYVGSDATYSSNTGFTVIDRGIDGVEMSTRNAIGQVTSLAPYDAFQPNNTLVTQNIESELGRNTTSIAMAEPRPDELDTGMDLIQGTRAYNEDSGQWTTPDAFAGDPSDPVSQLKYTWNRNNPIDYSDPNGYVPSASAFNWDGVPPASAFTNQDDGAADYQQSIQALQFTDNFGQGLSLFGLNVALAFVPGVGEEADALLDTSIGSEGAADAFQYQQLKNYLGKV
jgi:RHS repeat-associated protein